MANEFTQVVASLLKPAANASDNETVERYVTASDSVGLSDAVIVTTAAPERRVNYAKVGYSEAG